MFRSPSRARCRFSCTVLCYRPLIRGCASVGAYQRPVALKPMARARGRQLRARCSLFKRHSCDKRTSASFACPPRPSDVHSPISSVSERPPRSLLLDCTKYTLSHTTASPRERRLIASFFPNDPTTHAYELSRHSSRDVPLTPLRATLDVQQRTLFRAMLIKREEAAATTTTTGHLDPQRARESFQKRDEA